MAKIRRTIRKMKPAAGPSFDEQRWPVNLALIVMGGFWMGIVLAVVPKDDPRPLHNAWTYLGLIPLIVAGLIAALWKLDPKFTKRSLQLSMVLAVIAHMLVLVMLAVNHISPVAPFKAVVSGLEEIKEHVAREYEDMTLPDPNKRPEHERPVEAKPETPDTPEEEIEQEEDSEEPQPPPEDIETPPTPEKPPEPEVSPQPVERPVEQQSAPRQADHAAELSRQTAQAQPRPAQTQAVEAEHTPTEPPRAATVAQPNEAQAARQASVADLPQEVTPVEPTTPQVAETAPAAHRQPQQAPTPESTAQATMQRAVETPSTLPATAQVAETAPAAPQETQPNAPQPAEVAATQQPTVAPEVPQPREPTPTPVASAEAAATPVTRQQPVEAAPTLAQAAEPTPQAHRPVVSPPSNAQATEAAVASAPSTSEAPTPTPDAAEVAASPAAASTPQEAPQPSAEPATAPQEQAPQVASRRAEPASQATVQPNAAASDAPARAATQALAEASPRAVESPAASRAPRETARPQAEAAAAALSRAETGTAGEGAAVNLDRGLPAPETSPSQMASSSARRAQATQASETGPALTPSEPAEVSRMRAEAPIASSALPADTAEVATVHGSDSPDRLSASSGAAITRASADAPMDSITAAAGGGEVDIGPTQVVPSTGAGRASGGGQPELNPDSAARDLARADSGGAPEMLLATDAIAATAEAPPGDGGGQPQLPTVDVDGTAVAQGEPSEALPSLAGLTEEELEELLKRVGAARVYSATPAQRAEMIEAIQGLAMAGGGTQAPSRAAAGPSLPAPAVAAVAATGGEPASSGDLQGAPLVAQGSEISPQSGGIAAAMLPTEFGAAAGEVTTPAETSQLAGIAPGRRAASASGEFGPSGLATSEAGAPGRQGTSIRIGATSAAELAEAPIASPGGEGPAVQPDQLAGLQRGEPTPLAAGAIPVQVDEPVGPGGLATNWAPDTGVTSRRAQRQAMEVHLEEARFLREEIGGPLAIHSSAVASTDAYSPRRNRPGLELNHSVPGLIPPQTEEAIEKGLAFLAGQQNADGSWSFGSLRGVGYESETTALHSDTAATGLALLAFLGAGYHHRDHKYQDEVALALEFMLAHQAEDGDLYLSLENDSDQSMRLYSHGIATIALCEAYGMTQDPRLQEPAQKAIDWIVAAQHPERGGWRYAPQVGSDMSVSGWMLMALKSGDLANLDVPESTYEGVVTWLDLAQSPTGEEHLYRYNPYAVESQEQGRRPNLTMSSVGMLMRLYTSWHTEDAVMVSGAEYLLDNPPSNARGVRDAYYWYYATQVLFHMGGEYWEEWNSQLHPLLVESQVAEGPMAGSWDPSRPFPDRWGGKAGRIYVTTLNLLSLEVYYRHLPLYDEQRVAEVP